MAVIKTILRLNENREVTSNEAFMNFIEIPRHGARAVKERHDIAKRVIIYKIVTKFLPREKYREAKKRPIEDGPPLFRIAPGYETAVRDIQFAYTDAGIDAPRPAKTLHQARTLGTACLRRSQGPTARGYPQHRDYGKPGTA
jgi:hypothetical protein